MIRCDLALDTNGCWKVTELFQHLQDIIQRYPTEFAGNPVNNQNFKIAYIQFLLSTWILIQELGRPTKILEQEFYRVFLSHSCSLLNCTISS